MKKNILLLICVFTSSFFQAQTLKLEEIMKGNGFIGNLPENERWSLDGSKIYFDWNPRNDLGNSKYYWKKGMKVPQKATAEEAQFSKFNFLNREGSNVYYYADKGQIFSFAVSNKKIKKLYQSSSPISNLQLASQEGLSLIHI
jgi:hypothetical protein